VSTFFPAPEFAPGRFVDLPGRGRTFVRELAGPPGAPAIVLLHGWSATAALNWDMVMPVLARRYRVIAPDLRGHGRGIRSTAPWRFENDAADVASLIDVLGLDRPVVAGYSSGSGVATTLARDFPDSVGGLVLTAGGTSYPSSRPLGLGLRAAAALLRILPDSWFRGGHLPRRLAENGWLSPLDELIHHDLHEVVESGHDMETWDARPWLPSLRIPTVVLATTSDTDAPIDDQSLMARLIPGAELQLLDGNHYVPFFHPQRFTVALSDAVSAVMQRRLPSRSARTL
jgi:3-oxoadipate enol-lactonase